MKIKALLIAGGVATLGGFALSGCVQDQYGAGYGQFGYGYSYHGGVYGRHYDRHDGDRRWDGRRDGRWRDGGGRSW